MANEKTYPNYLMHGRTKGSRNGISTTKGYIAIGQRAKGRWVNGRYVYPQTVYPKAGVVTGPRPKYQSPMDYARREGYARYEAHKAVNNKKLTFDTPRSYGGNAENTQSGAVSKPAWRHPQGHVVNGHYVYYEDEARNRAFQQGKAEARGRNSAYENQAMVKRMENDRKADVLDQKIYGKKIKGYTRLADISPYEKQRLTDKYLSNSPQHQAAVNQHNANVSGMNAALKYQQKQAAVKKAKEDGAKNDWQQQAAAKSSLARVRNDLYTGKSRARYTKFWDSEGEAVPFPAVQDKSYKNALAKHDAKQRAEIYANSKYSNQAHQNAVSQAAAERKAREAALGRQKKASTKNAINTSPYTGDPRYTRQMQDIRNRAGKYITSVGTNDKPKLAKTIALEKATHNAAIESSKRNSRSDIGNAFSDAKEDAKNLFKKLKSKFKKNKK